MRSQNKNYGNDLTLKKKRKSIDSDIESLLNGELEIVKREAYFKGATVLMKRFNSQGANNSFYGSDGDHNF